MVRAAIRSILARKVRLLLTSLAVVLGVGFMAGTYVLTDTMTNAFNSLFETTYSRIDVLVRASNAFTAQTSSLEEREPMPESVLEQVRAMFAGIAHRSAEGEFRASFSGGLTTLSRAGAGLHQAARAALRTARAAGRNRLSF